MFISKEEYRLQQIKMDNLQEENERLVRCVKSWQEENKRLKNDLDYEHVEKHKMRQIINSMKKIANKAYGSYESAAKIVKDIQKELSNT